VIDDEGLVTASLRQLLSKSGYEVETADNAQTAMDKVRKGNFDLIISDIKMPEVNGIEIVKGIRKYLNQAGKPAVPEILITGYAEKENIEQAEELKVNDFIYKPFNINEFLDAVKKNLEPVNS